MVRPHSWSCQVLAGYPPEIGRCLSAVSCLGTVSAHGRLPDRRGVSPVAGFRAPGADAGTTVHAAATSSAAAAGSGSTVGLRGLSGSDHRHAHLRRSQLGRADRRPWGSYPGLGPHPTLAGPRSTPLAFGSELDRSPRPGRGMGLDRRNRQRDGPDRSLNQSNRLNRRDAGTDRDDHGIDHCHV